MSLKLDGQRSQLWASGRDRATADTSFSSESKLDGQVGS